MADLLVADIGGTNTRLAVLQDRQLPSEPRVFRNAEYPSFESILSEFAGFTGALPDRAAFAVAGPVSNNAVQMTNLGWMLNAMQLTEEFGFAECHLLNDFEALAWATLQFSQDELLQVGGAEPMPAAARAILGPGTGLGVSGLVPGANGWAAIRGEGGHVALAGMTEQEAELVSHFVAQDGFCSAETLISGAGLARIHAYTTGTPMAPEEITCLALEGDEAARESLEIFCKLLGTVAADLALTLGARGGVYLAGGILPTIGSHFEASGFRARFYSNPRMRAYLAAIPVYLVKPAFPVFGGLAEFVAGSNR